MTAYEVFTGTLPWEKAESLQTLLSHMNQRRPATRASIEAGPATNDVAAFLTKAIERDPAERRFQNPEQFAEALDSLPKC